LAVCNRKGITFMTIKTRQQERLEILSVILRELAQMDRELAQLASDWTISFGLLYLMFQGVVPGTIGAPCIMVITSIDFMRLWEIYLDLKTSGELGELTEEQ